VGKHDGLLERHMPQLRYDVNEQFFADAAEEVLALGNAELRRPGRDQPLAGGAALSLELLGAEYGAGLGSAKDGDYLVCVRQDHRELSQRMHEQAELRNVIYGRAKPGGDGRLWLQYWLYYFYNDYSMAGGFGLHEGDWELVQLCMKEDPEDGPDFAVYAQHKHAQRRDWKDVGTIDHEGIRPIVWVASGSHASYFEKGLHKAGRAGPFTWWDVAEGGRGTPSDTRLVVLDDDALPGWVEWPGTWGGTRARIKGLEQPSPPGPRGPSAKHRPHWEDPAAIEYVHEPPKVVPLPEEPPVEISRDGDRVVLRYDIHALLGSEHPPERMTVTVNKKQSAEERTRTPPRTYTFAIEHTRSGTLVIEAWLDSSYEYDVSVRLVSPGGKPSSAKTVILGPPPAGQAGVRRWNAFARALGAGWSRSGRPVFRLLHRTWLRLRGKG
jgi:hypothetical protein